jgi:hypothetical protein
MAQKTPDPRGGGPRAVFTRSGTRLNIAPTKPVNLLDARFARGCERLHKLGPRVLGELLAEIGARYLLRAPIEALVQWYVERLDREFLAELGIDQFPAPPLRSVGGGR